MEMLVGIAGVGLVVLVRVLSLPQPVAPAGMRFAAALLAAERT